MAEFFIYKDKNGWKGKAWKDYLDSLEEGKYKVTIVSSRKRSLQQNNWIHAVLPDILQGLRDAGYNDVRTLNDAKDFIKSMFFRKTVTNGIDSIDVVEGTSEQSRLDFASKATDIIQWAAEYLGIDIAPPEKQLECL